MKQRIEWIESGGGPLLFAPRSALTDWNGNRPSTNLSALTDYDRACAVKDEIGVISVGKSHALVFGDEPDRTTLIATSSSSLVMVRWRWAESEDSLLSSLSQTEIDSLPPKSNGTFRVLSDEYMLFDSAYVGTEVVRALSVRLESGIYSFDALDFRPNESTCALIHRIRIQLGMVKGAGA